MGIVWGPFGSHVRPGVPGQNPIDISKEPSHRPRRYHIGYPNCQRLSCMDSVSGRVPGAVMNHECEDFVFFFRGGFFPLFSYGRDKLINLIEGV